MKRIFLMVFFIASVLFVKTSTAQFTVGLSFNIGSQPAWGPVGYEYARYYYLPDIDVYYNLQSKQYIYLQYGVWRYSPYLPSRARSYDIYRGHKVVINEPKPYLNHNIYKQKYARYRNDHSQPVIRDSRERKYYESKGHPEHQQWEKQRQKEIEQHQRNNNRDEKNEHENNQKNKNGKKGNNGNNGHDNH